MRKILLGILFGILLFIVVYKSPLSSAYYYNKAKSLYNAGMYEEAITVFERALFADKKNMLTRFYYVLALSKAEPKLSIQKKLYAISNSKVNDEAQKYAKYQVVSLRHKLLADFDDNYIYNAAMGKGILRWDIKSFPLRVYYENIDTVPEYYKTNIDKALKQWTDRTNFIKFTEVKDSSNADIIIKFNDLPKDICSGGICKYAVAYTDPIITPDGVLQRMELTFYKKNPNKNNFTPMEIYNTALHELGHTLGIMGHSDKKEDLMYSSNENNMNMYALYRSDFQYLSLRDLQTLILLYRIEPTISNVKGLTSESFYYAPLILGSGDERLRKKLEELKKYIHDYPDFAAGYINISSVYVESGDFDSALEALNSAAERATTKDEKFLIAYNRAAIYYNKQDYNNALSYAREAKSIKNSNNIDELISEIQKLHN